MAEITKKEAEKAIASNERAKAQKKAQRSFMTEVMGAAGYGVARRVLLEKTTIATTLPGGELTLDGGVAAYGLYKGSKRSGGKMRDAAVGAGMVALGHVADYVGKKVADALPAAGV